MTVQNPIAGAFMFSILKKNVNSAVILSEVLQQCIVAAAFYDRLAGAVGVGLENNTGVVMEFA